MKIKWFVVLLILISICFFVSGCGSKGTFVETVAGSDRGYNNATGVAAQFNTPFDIAVDSEGVVYVADSANHVIRMITADGEVSTYAGSGEVGHGDGSALEANFSTPTGIAIDLYGNIYVADSLEMDPHPMRVRVISTDLDVTTLAGSLEAGYKDAVGIDARFKVPANIAVGSDGVIFVADTNNHRIRRIDPNGTVTTIAGKPETGYAAGYVDGSASESRFNGPRGVAIDEAGNVYVADTGNHVIRLITPDGQVSTLAGDKEPGYIDAIGTKARFNFPSDVAIDEQGNVYVADTANHRIRIITQDREVTTLAGTGEPGNLDGSPLEAQFQAPEGVAVDQEGNIFVADTGNHSIRKIILP
jgi:sugar lactone lactonase YvrE